MSLVLAPLYHGRTLGSKNAPYVSWVLQSTQPRQIGVIISTALLRLVHLEQYITHFSHALFTSAVERVSPEIYSTTKCIVRIGDFDGPTRVSIVIRSVVQSNSIPSNFRGSLPRSCGLRLSKEVQLPRESKAGCVLCLRRHYCWQQGEQQRSR